MPSFAEDFAILVLILDDLVIYEGVLLEWWHNDALQAVEWQDVVIASSKILYWTY